jgi:hypothetical protein
MYRARRAVLPASEMNFPCMILRPPRKQLLRVF